MLVTINNIDWRFEYNGNDAVGDEENLGIANLFIPGPMMKRFIKECGNDGIMPHYDREDAASLDSYTSGYSSHACWNSDTQIVLMHYLFNKRRRYKLTYEGLDPYWLFHDSRHAINDVYGYEVSGVYSGVEAERLVEGAELAKKSGVYMRPQTACKLLGGWRSRFKSREGSSMQDLTYRDVIKFLNPHGIAALDYYLEIGVIEEFNYDHYLDYAAEQEDDDY
jgi:hypothetical protein